MTEPGAACPRRLTTSLTACRMHFRSPCNAGGRGIFRGSVYSGDVIIVHRCAFCIFREQGGRGRGVIGPRAALPQWPCSLTAQSPSLADISGANGSPGPWHAGRPHPPAHPPSPSLVLILPVSHPESLRCLGWLVPALNPTIFQPPLSRHGP